LNPYFLGLETLLRPTQQHISVFYWARFIHARGTVTFKFNQSESKSNNKPNRKVYSFWRK